MQLSIVSPAPHYLRNSGDLVGTYLRNRPGTYPGLVRGDISVKRAENLLLQDVRICRDSDKGAQVMGQGPTRGFTRKMYPAVPGSIQAVPWTSKKYKIESPGKSPLSPGSGGQATIDSCIMVKKVFTCKEANLFSLYSIKSHSTLYISCISRNKHSLVFLL